MWRVRPWVEEKENDKIWGIDVHIIDKNPLLGPELHSPPKYSPHTPIPLFHDSVTYITIMF